MRLKQGAKQRTPRTGAALRARASRRHRPNVPVWVRNEWNASQKNVVDAARAAGTDSPILFVFVPKASAQELREQIIRAEAARGTIDGRGAKHARRRRGPQQHEHAVE